MNQQNNDILTVEQCADLMPHWLGRPMYPGGGPVRPENYTFEDATMQEIYFRHSGVDPDKFGEKKPSDENILVAYALYYINAPIFDLNDSDYMTEFREKAKAALSFDELWKICIDYGVDPF
jgi:hypothetical protein